MPHKCNYIKIIVSGMQIYVWEQLQDEYLSAVQFALELIELHMNIIFNICAMCWIYYQYRHFKCFSFLCICECILDMLRKQVMKTVSGR